jgi:hypothetical protein
LWISSRAQLIIQGGDAVLHAWRFCFKIELFIVLRGNLGVRNLLLLQKISSNDLIFDKPEIPRIDVREML